MTEFSSWLRRGSERKDWATWNATHPYGAHPRVSAAPATPAAREVSPAQADPTPTYNEHPQLTKPAVRKIAKVTAPKKTGPAKPIRALAKARISRATTPKSVTHVGKVPKVHAAKKVARLHHVRTKKLKVKKPKAHHVRIKKPKKIPVRKPRLHHASTRVRARAKRRKKK
jgi:hypothetical protein